jgi:hypothetical protein
MVQRGRAGDSAHLGRGRWPLACDHLSHFPQKTTSADQSRKGRRAAACELDMAPAWILTRSTETPSCPWASAVTGTSGGAPANLRPRLARAARPLRARGRVSEAVSSEPLRDDAGIEEREQEEEETDQACHDDQRIGPVHLLLAPIRFLDLLHLSRTIGGKPRISIGPRRKERVELCDPRPAAHRVDPQSTAASLQARLEILGHASNPLGPARI